MEKIKKDMELLGKEIETAKTNISQLKGQRIEIVNQLEKEFEVTEPEKIKILMDTLQIEMDKLEEEIPEEFEELKKDFQW